MGFYVPLGPRGFVMRLGSLVQSDVTTWSTLHFNVANREDVLADQLEIYRRGVADAPRPPCCCRRA